MDLAAAYRFRAPTTDDLAAATDVLVADDLDDAGEVVLDAGFLAAQWGRSGFDLATDAWLAVDETETIVAYGQATLDEPGVVGSWGVVHPQSRGRGIGSALLDRIEARAAGWAAGGDGSIRLRNAINAGDLAAARLLEGRGFRLVRHFWHMRIDLPGPVDFAHVPQGIELAPVRPSDGLPAVHAVLDEAFLDHWGYEPEPFERWVEDRTGASNYDPTLWSLATADGRPAGALTAGVRGERGWIDLLGVLAPYRGRGIGAALLRRSFAAFADRGVRQVYLAVDAENPTGATRLYERVGMRVAKRWDLWER